MIIPEVLPLPGRDVANILQVLRAQAQTVHEWVSGSADERLTRYHGWAPQAADILEGVLAADSVDRLIRTPRHDLMMSKVTAHNVGMVNHTLNAEARWQINSVQSLIDELEAAAAACAMWPETVLVPDTNIYLHQDPYFDLLPWREWSGASHPVRVLIPAAVLRELDKSKNGNGQNRVSDTCKETVRTRARVTSRRIRTRFTSPRDVVELADGVSLELLLDAPRHRRLEREDDEIIERAEAIQSLAGRDVRIVTQDGNMQFAAQVAGVGVLPLPD